MDRNGIGTTTMDNLWRDADPRSGNTHAGTGRAVRYLHGSLHLAGHGRCVAPVPPVFGERLSRASPIKRGNSCLRSLSPFSFYRRSLCTRSWAARILAVGYGTCWRSGPAPNGSVRRSPTPSRRYGKPTTYGSFWLLFFCSPDSREVSQP